MKSAQSKTTTLRHRLQRAGFTLVELLMVVVIIGILIGMLSVAINPVLRTARETAVTVEMKQMELAIENFQNKYGFYPPSFTGLTTSAQLLPFLNKLSPNHRELNDMFPGVTKLDVWWAAIGSKLDDRGSLIFWLSGLSNNKQFPITGNLPILANGNAQLPVIFNADLAIQIAMSDISTAVNVGGVDEFDFAAGTTLERETLFDFRGGQLSRDLPGGAGMADPGIRIYNSPFGNAKGDLAYRYRDNAFYDLADPAGVTSSPVAGRSRDAFHVNTNRGPVFLNPDTFQLSTFGLDGQASPFASSAINQPTIDNDPNDDLTPSQWREFSSDNIANFANGRLDGFDWTEAVELGGREAQ